MHNWNKLDISLLKHGFDGFYLNLLEEHKVATENFQNYFNVNNKNIIELDILASKTINARARLKNDKYYIGIHSALPCILHFTFNILFRTSEYFSEIGKVKDEEPHGEFSNGIPLVLPEDVPIEEALWGIVATSRPIDDKRAEAASLLTELAMKFCSYHELAHIQTGHVLSMRELFGESEYLEFFGKNTPFFNDKMGRIWEYEADKIAIIMMAGNDMLDQRNQDYFADTFCIDLKKDLHKLFGIILSSLYVLFHLLSQNYSKPDFFSNHPHPILRYSYVSSEMVNFIARHFNYSEAETIAFKGKLADFVINSQQAWLELGLSLSKDLTLRSTANWVLKETDKLEYNRKKYSHLYSDKAWIYPFA